MEQATCTIIQLGDRWVTLAVSAAQLAVRNAGDLITAEIVSVDMNPRFIDNYKSA